MHSYTDGEKYELVERCIKASYNIETQRMLVKWLRELFDSSKEKNNG